MYYEYHYANGESIISASDVAPKVTEWTHTHCECCGNVDGYYAEVPLSFCLIKEGEMPLQPEDEVGFAPERVYGF